MTGRWSSGLVVLALVVGGLAVPARDGAGAGGTEPAELALARTHGHRHALAAPERADAVRRITTRSDGKGLVPIVTSIAPRVRVVVLDAPVTRSSPRHVRAAPPLARGPPQLG